MEISIGVDPVDPLERAQFELLKALTKAYTMPGLAEAVPGTLSIHLMANDSMQSATFEWITKQGVRKQQTVMEQL